MKNNNLIVTIDGLAASGKGTVAKKLAHDLNYFYLDTGKIYRLVGLQAYNQSINPEMDMDMVITIAQNLANNFSISLMDNPQLKSDVIGQMASRIAPDIHLRQAILDLQRHLANTPPDGFNGAVLDGRDCGTVICPNAPYKFYITAAQDVRAQRRHQELLDRGDDIDFETVLADMKQRDDRDTQRDNAPTKPAIDAVTIDTTTLSVDEVLYIMKETLSHVKNT